MFNCLFQKWDIEFYVVLQRDKSEILVIKHNSFRTLPLEKGDNSHQPLKNSDTRYKEFDNQLQAFHL